MINKLKSKLLVVLSAITFVTLSFGFVLFSGVKTNNAVAQESTPFMMKEGASVRKEDPTGIRFSAMISSDKYAEIIENGVYKDGYKVGMIIVPKEFFDDFNAQKEEGNPDYYDYFKNVKGQIRDLPFNEDQFIPDEKVAGYYNVNGAIVDIKEANLGLEYQAVAYISYTDGETTTYTYTDVSASRTVQYVAVAAINEGKLTDDEVEDLASIYGVNYAKVSVKTDALEEPVTVNAANEGNVTFEDVSFAVKQKYGYSLNIESIKKDGSAVSTVESGVTYTAEVAQVTVNGTINSSIASFANTDGNKLVFVRENGEKIVADVTKENGGFTYSATLPEGKYTRASFVNFATGEFNVTGAGEMNVALTTGNNYVDESLVSGMSANLLENGSVQAKPIAGTNSYVQLPDVTFMPGTQTLTFGYTLTGMNQLGVHGNTLNTAIGFCIGEVEDQTKGGGYNLFAAYSAPCPTPATRIAPNASQIVDRAGINTITAKIVADADWTDGKLLNWNSSHVNQKYDFKWIINGYTVNLYIKMNQGSQWITVFEGRNLYSIYNGEVDLETNDTAGAVQKLEYLNALYSLEKECNFGVTIRRDSSGTNNGINVCNVSNVWYNIANNE